MQENDILLTIAIPTYNRVDYLKRSLASVLTQLDDGVEIIISDNAATDTTQEYMEGIVNDYPSVKYVRNSENIGPDNNFLQCYKLANGKFVLLLGDDDILVENALKHILDFLKNDGANCTFVYMNHAYFKGEYAGIDRCNLFNPKLKNDFITTDKEKLMDIARERITYMSSFLLNRQAFLSVQDPIKYNDTSFMHTCIAFEATRDNNSIFGVIAKPCIAQDFSFGNSSIEVNLHTTFKVFGKGMEYTLCTVAVNNNYSKKQMNRIYTSWISRGWPGTVLKLKEEKNIYWKREFKLYGLPVLKKHKSAYFRVMPFVWMPRPLAILLRKINNKRKLKKSEKN